MPLLFAILALFTPRLIVVLLWFTTHWFQGLFPSLLWPIVGFLFMPTTLLWYSAVLVWFNGQWTLWPVVGIVLAIMIDLSPVSAGRGRRTT